MQVVTKKSEEKAVSRFGGTSRIG